MKDNGLCFFPQTFIKAEETVLKKQILSLNEQFQELMISVAELYPDILNEDLVQKPEANKPERDILPNDEHVMSSNYKDTLQRMERKSRWDEWRERRVRRRYSGGDMDLKDKHSLKPDGMKREKTTRPSSLNVNELSENSLKGKLRNSTRSNDDSPNSESATPTADASGAASPDDCGLKLLTLDSERRRRIRQRLKESRKKLDVVHLGLF